MREAYQKRRKYVSNTSNPRKDNPNRDVEELGCRISVGQSLGLKDYLDLISGTVSDKLKNFAIAHALPRLRDSVVTVKTIHRKAASEEEDYEHTYPVIRRIREPKIWTLPRGRIIFEPELEGTLRYGYHRNQFKPAEIALTIDGRARRYKWTLVPEMQPRVYEIAHRDNSDFVPVTNTTRFGPTDRFTIFHYVHEDDSTQSHPAKIFYKQDGDRMTLHCVSIPLNLISLLIDSDNSGSRNEHILQAQMRQNYSSGLLRQPPRNNSYPSPVESPPALIFAEGTH